MDRINLEKVIVFGEVLFDLFPDKKRLGGAPFNFAMHLHRFGVPVFFMSRIGNDVLGEEILNFIGKNDFPKSGIQVDKTHSTGEVRINISNSGEHSFEILPKRAWDYIEWNNEIRKALNEKVAMVYFGTLSQREVPSRQTLQKILQEIPKNTPVFLDLNLRAPFYNREILKQSLKFCNILKANDEEILELKKVFNWPASMSLSEICQKIQVEYNIETLCVTKGKEGSELYRINKKTPQYQVSNAPEPFLNSVGAGDAFSARFAFGLLNNWQDQVLLTKASLFASQVCTIPGAIPEDPNFYQQIG